MMGALITEPGFHFDLSPADYFAEPCPDAAMTNSGIGVLMGPKFKGGVAPAKYKHWHPRLNPDNDTAEKATAALVFGSVAHRIALGKGSDYEISPYDEYRSAEAKAWKADVLQRGAYPIKQAEFDAAKAVGDIWRAQIEHRYAGCEFYTEAVLAWVEETEHGPIWCRTMLDVWCPERLEGMDLKSCIDASDDALDRRYSDGYAVQEYWQRRGISRLIGEYGRIKMPFMFCEKTAPWLTRTVDSSEAYLSGAEMICNRALNIAARCQHSGEWPGYERYTAQPTPWWLNDCAALEYEEAA